MESNTVLVELHTESVQMSIRHICELIWIATPSGSAQDLEVHDRVPGSADRPVTYGPSKSSKFHPKVSHRLCDFPLSIKAIEEVEIN